MPAPAIPSPHLWKTRLCQRRRRTSARQQRRGLIAYADKDEDFAAPSTHTVRYNDNDLFAPVEDNDNDDDFPDPVDDNGNGPCISSCR
jgi:hypothetical protein